MKTTVNNYEFHRAFETTRPDNFTHAGLNALFDYLEDYEESTGEEIELDVIALCCDFSEYENIKDFQANYGGEYESLSDIANETILIRIKTEEDEDGNEDGSFIIQNF